VRDAQTRAAAPETASRAIPGRALLDVTVAGRQSIPEPIIGSIDGEIPPPTYSMRDCHVRSRSCERQQHSLADRVQRKIVIFDGEKRRRAM
jgi:hypothetical protein